MIDEELARLRAHRNNINRYHRLLKTELTEFERRFIERRLSEERAAVDKLSAATFPIALTSPAAAIGSAPTLRTAGSLG